MTSSSLDPTSLCSTTTILIVGVTLVINPIIFKSVFRFSKLVPCRGFERSDFPLLKQLYKQSHICNFSINVLFVATHVSSVRSHNVGVGRPVNIVRISRCCFGVSSPSSGKSTMKLIKREPLSYSSPYDQAVIESPNTTLQMRKSYPVGKSFAFKHFQRVVGHNLSGFRLD